MCKYTDTDSAVITNNYVFLQNCNDLSITLIVIV